MYKSGVIINGKSEKLVKDKLLTIGIITRNESEKLERCLKSLMPLKEAIDCEIILTDTGSNDNTIEMAENYVDKIIDFEWCDDFAAARNTGIDVAQGLWFMWVDSDEWFEDVEEIISFFKSEDYKKYISATLTFIDYRDREKKNYSELTIFRMTLLHSNTRFNGQIHEMINVIAPTKQIPTKLYHDGYIFGSEREKLSKHQRNLEALLNIYENKPTRPDIISYIVDQYNFIGDFEKVDEYCQIGIDISQSLKDKTSKSHYLNFLIMKATNFLNMGRNNKAVELLEGLEDKQDENSYRFLDINAVLSNAYFNLGQKDKSFEFAKKFMDYYIIQDKLDSTNKCIFILIFSQKNIIETMFFRCIKYLINQRTSEKGIFDYLEQIQFIMVKNSKDGFTEYNTNIIRGSLELQRYSLIKKLYTDTRTINKIDVVALDEMLISALLDYRECVEAMLESLADLDIKSEVITLAKIINIDSEASKEDIQSWIETYNQINNKSIKSEMIYLAIENNLNLDILIAETDVFNIIETLKLSILNHNRFLESIVRYYESKEIPDKNIKSRYFMVALMEYFIVIDSSDDEILEVYKIFELEVPKLLNSMYSKAILNEDNICLLPNLFRFGYYIQNANIYKKKNDYVSYVKTLKMALREYPIMEVPIKNSIIDLESYIEEVDNRDRELEDLAKSIKQKIYEFITMGNNKEALSIITQLQSIRPNDNELKELKTRITLKI